MSRLRILPSRNHGNNVNNSNNRPVLFRSQHIAAAALCLSVVYGWVSWHYLASQSVPSAQHHEKSNNRREIGRRPPAVIQGRRRPIPVSQQTTVVEEDSNGGSVLDTCAFRQYPPHRYYKLQAASQPDFLTSATEYIYGQWPQILPQTTEPAKLCIDQTEWAGSSSSTPTTTKTWPFADGTNPSLLSVDRLRHLVAPSESVQRFLAQVPSHVTWLATVCMTNSQCAWKDTEAQIEEFHLSRKTKPDTVRTLLLLLDENFQKVSQSTIYLNVDAAWGKKVRPPPRPERRIVALDDARLFLHDGNVWVSYREGPGFGYESQVLNPLGFEWTTPPSSSAAVNVNSSPALLHVTATASETTFFCCGRNMALMEDRQQPHQLLSLTWVDPVTVEYVNTTAQPVPLPKPRKRALPRRLQSLSEDQQHRRRLGQHRKQHKSHIHGTNAFMVYVPKQDVFLGVAHFHRPNDRQQNPHARFGHHYTHAFFTIAARDSSWHLQALSAEFVYPATTVASADAEIIQFSSGLELTPDGDVALAYGINDCEAAVTTVPWSVVESMLQPVPLGTQVVDAMRPLTASL